MAIPTPKLSWRINMFQMNDESLDLIFRKARTALHNKPQISMAYCASVGLIVQTGLALC